MKPNSSFLTALFTAFFWIFNITLLFIVYLGILPFFGISLLMDAAAGQVPFNFLLTFFGLVTVPTGCSVAGIMPKKWQPISLFRLFYGVEAPLLLVCFTRFFWLRELTPTNSLLLLTGLLGAIAFGHWLLARRDNPMEVNVGHLIAQTLVLAIALYLTSLAAFYVLPTLSMILGALPQVIVYSLILVPVWVLVVGWCTLPFGMAIAYGRSWRDTMQQLGTRYGTWKVRGLAAASLAVWLIAFIAFQQQHQLEAFRLLNNPPQNDQQKQELLQKTNVIRSGLLNAYLAAYRYPRFHSTEVQEMYKQTLRFPEEAAQTIQSLFDFLTIPFTYIGNVDEDVALASKLYADFFDAPILRGEQAIVQKALQSTFDRTAAKAGLDDINQQRVLLAEQHLTVKPQGDWAEIELYEVYQNTTTLPEEILYYFSLPESATITGLWLSDEAQVPKKYAYTISPRGAAQQVYTNQVVRNTDPALLEQTGPRSYRLRAFPVPAMGLRIAENGNLSTEPARLYLWLSYKVLKQEAGWALPNLLEQRNVFWTGATKRMINGKTVTASNQWLPAALPADQTPPTEHQLTLPWGAHVLATPFAASDYQLPQGKRFAVVLDRSYSMEAHRQQVTETFRWMQDHILKQNSADLYLTAIAPDTQPQRLNDLQPDLKGFNPAGVTFYGTVQPKEMLAQFQKVKGETTYDAVLVITDAGSYELNNDTKLQVTPTAPLWFVHLGGLPFAYDDVTLKALQDSDGGAATDVQEVMQRIGTQPSRGEGTSFLNVVDGYAWFLTQNASAVSAAEGFGALAARQWTTHLSHYLKPNDLSQLDAIHAAAKEYGIVTPYSSMLVLVNDQQREELKKAEQQSDRFDRKVEDQQLPMPKEISAVPEPAEWLLIAVGAIALWGVYQYRERWS